MKANMFIGGEWVESVSGEFYESVNPATGEIVAEIPQGNREDADRAVQEAVKAKDELASMSIWERSQILQNIADQLQQQQEEVAEVLSRENGKPLQSEAMLEVQVAVAGFRNAAEHIKWLETSVIPMEGPNKRAVTIRQPRGVYAVVTPFNFPVNIPVEYIAPGLGAGNTLVWSPAPNTAYCAVKLLEVLEEAGVPDGAINLVTGPGSVVGDEIVGHEDVDGVGFTGSAETGRLIAERAAGKPQLLEQGGNGPTIVMEDADLEEAAEGAALGCFICAGQTCSATERVIVHENILSEFMEHFEEQTKEFVPGDPLEEGTTLGPLNNEKIASRVEEHVSDAIEKGATVVREGGRLEGFETDLFFEPTILRDVPSDSLLNKEETFGPVAPVTTFTRREEALRIVDESPYGLLCSVYTQSLEDAYYFGENINAGIVNVNEHSNYWEPHVPFGGASGKNSGTGRIGGKQTLLEMTDLKTIVLDVG